MKNEEFYSKSKSKDKFPIHPLITKKNWWAFVLFTLLIVAFEPIVAMNYQRHTLSSWGDYFKQALLIAEFLIPAELVILWIPQIRLIAIQRKGFDWIGRFEVIGKEISISSHYVILYPGNAHRLKVESSLYEKTKIGDYLLVRRNAFGDVKEIIRFPNIRRRITRTLADRNMI